MDRDRLLATIGQGHSGDAYVGAGLHVGERGLDEIGDDHVAGPIFCVVPSRAATVRLLPSTLSMVPRIRDGPCCCAAAGNTFSRAHETVAASSFAVMLGME